MKFMNKKRTVSFLLALLMLSSGLISCSDTPVDDTEKSGDETVSPVAGGSEMETETEYSILNTLPEYDFQGSTITALTRDDIWWQLTKIDAEETNAETINDALFDRNAMFESTYNVDFQAMYVQSTLAASVRTAVSSGDAVYDFVIPALNDAATMVNEDLIINLNTINSIDFTNPAWDQNAVEYYSVANKLYYGVSDISLGKNESAWVYMFNKTLLAEYGLENPYDLVREKKWTFDKTLEMMEVASNDMNGNGEADEGDRFGLATHNVNYYALLISAGQALATKDTAEDKPVMNVENDNFVAVYDKLKADFTDTNQTIMEYQGETFIAGNALLCGQVLACVRLYREMEDDFGIIPTPMYTEEQGEYHTFVIPYDVFASCIPTSAADPERSGMAMQILSIYSQHYLTPAYYDITITGKGLRDEDSAEMLDVILSSTVYDLALMYNWGGFPNGVAANIENGREFTSGYKRKKTAINKEIETLVEVVQNNNN